MRSFTPFSRKVWAGACETGGSPARKEVFSAESPQGKAGQGMKKFIKTYLIDEFGKREGESLDEKAEQKLAQLNNNAPGKSKTQQRYLMGSIFPVISVYQTFQQSGMTKEKAIIHMEKMIGENTRNHTRKMWEMLGKLPFFSLCSS